MYQSDSQHQLLRHSRSQQVIRLERRPDGKLLFWGKELSFEDYLAPRGWELIDQSEYIGRTEEGSRIFAAHISLAAKHVAAFREHIESLDTPTED